MPTFNFRTLSYDARSEPLATQKTAATWFRQLPRVDTIGRQQIVTRTIESAFRSPGEFRFEQVGAIEFLDAELATDRGRLVAQYVEHSEGSAVLANRIWQAAYDISQGFIIAYQSLLDRALGAASEARWKQVAPRLAARLTHFYGTDARLRVLKNETWIPAKWVELHRLYKRAVELGFEHAPGSDLPGSGAPRPTVELEYVGVLLAHLLNTGMLAPREIDWAAVQVRAWAAGLGLDADPRTPGGFVVDVGGKRGLVRRRDNESGVMLRYLDTGPLTERLDRAIAALSRSGTADPEGAGSVSRQRIAILERLHPLVSPDAPAAVPREPRTRVNLSAQVRTGLSQICQELSPGDMQDVTIELAAGAEPSAIPRDDPESPRRSSAALTGAPPVAERLWRVEDRSSSGMRIAASTSLGQNPVLGMLVAIREAGDDGWLLGAVRRVVRPTPEKIQAGVSIIASRVIAVTLHAKRQAREEMGFVVDGVDVSTVGERFDGLYLPPAPRPVRPAAKTLVIPSSEYDEGRHIILITTRTVYTVALREPLERHPDWTWVAIDIILRTARE